MTRKTSTRGIWYLILIDIIAAALVAGLAFIQKQLQPRRRAFRTPNS